MKNIIDYSIYNMSVDYTNRIITLITLSGMLEKESEFFLRTKEDIVKIISEIEKQDVPSNNSISASAAAIAAAFGYYFLALEASSLGQCDFLAKLDDIADDLLNIKPSSANLFWCLNRLYHRAVLKSPHKGEMLEAMRTEAENMQNELDNILKCISSDTFSETQISDVQIVELLLFFCQSSNQNKRRSIRKVSAGLLEYFGSLNNLLESDTLEICTALGKTLPEKSKQSIGILFSLVPGIYMRCQVRRLSGEVLETPFKAAEYAKALLYGKTIEHLYLLLMDKNNNLIDAILLGKGTIDSSAMYPRESVRAALKHKEKAHYAVLAHNHPSGSLNMSQDDITATVKAKEALELVGIMVVDHIIIAGEDYTSFAETRTHPFDH